MRPCSGADDPLLPVIRKFSARTDVRVTDIVANPETFRGASLYLEGRVTGVISAADGCTYIVKVPNQPTVYLESGETTPAFRVGHAVRAVARLPEDSKDGVTFQMIAMSRQPAPAKPKPEKPAARGQPKAEAQPTGARAEAAVKPEPSAAKPAEPPKPAAGEGPAPAKPNTGHDKLLHKYAEAIRRFNPRLPTDYARQLADVILKQSTANRLDPRLLVAVVAVESRFRPYAVSPKGAMGLGQLMPGTAAGMGVSNAFDPVQNIAAAARIISRNLRRYAHRPKEQFALALAAYNAGSGAVSKYGGVPPYRETIDYIWKVYYIYRQLAPELFGR